MPEQKIQVQSNGKYNNIYLKDYKDFKGLEPGNFIIVEKAGNYSTAYKSEGVGKDNKPYTMFTCRVLYDGKDCSFTLFNEKQATQFNEAGGVGDKVKISCELYKNKKGTYSTLFKFEPAQ